MKRVISLTIGFDTARNLVKQIDIAEGEGFHYDDTNDLKNKLEKTLK